MRRYAKSRRNQKFRQRRNKSDDVSGERSSGKEKRIRSRRSKRKAARAKAKALSAKQLLARQRHRTAVSSIFCAIAIAILLVIGLMLYTIANYEPREIPDIVVYQTAAPEAEPEKPSPKARVQSSASRPKLPSVKLIRAKVASPIAIQTVKIEDPSMNFEIGSEVEGLDFGNGGSGMGEGNGKKGTLGGMEISANQLGVVLDVSGSMSGVLPALENDISRRFPWALTERVTGCSIFGDMKQPGDQGTLKAIKYLVEEGEADAIFWFCDLQDSRDPEAVLSLAKYLKEKKVKLYLSSTEKSPDEELRKAVTKFSRWSSFGN